MTTQILIADDHPLFRSAMKQAILHIAPRTQIIEADSLKNAEDVLKQQKEKIGMLFLDLRMSDSKGLAGMMLIKAAHPKLPIVIVSASDEVTTIRAAIKSGAVGYIVKSYSPQQISAAFTDIKAGKVHIPESVKHAIAHNEDVSDSLDNFRSLTQTQLRVLVKMSNGLLNKQIAGEMGITEATVKSHVTEVLRKLNCRNRTQAVVIAKELDVVLSDR